jgi:hypothetical protein
VSRSHRKHPICGITCAESEKQDKRLLNRRVRRVNRQRLHADKEPAQRNQLYDPWTMDKDGKQYFDPTRFPELLRK